MQLSGGMFSSGSNSLKILYQQLSALNRQVVREEVTLSLDELTKIDDNRDSARKFLSEYHNKKGSIYDQIIADETGLYATRIRALAGNIFDVITQQARLDEFNKDTDSSP